MKFKCLAKLITQMFHHCQTRVRFSIEGLQNSSQNVQASPGLNFCFPDLPDLPFTRSTIRPYTYVFYSFKRALSNKLIPKEEINICSVGRSSSCFHFDMESCLVFFSYVKSRKLFRILHGIALFGPDREMRTELTWSTISSLIVIINQKERDHWEDQDLGGWIILK
jgi:hypothetical protein